MWYWSRERAARNDQVSVLAHRPDLGASQCIRAVCACLSLRLNEEKGRLRDAVMGPIVGASMLALLNGVAGCAVVQPPEVVQLKEATAEELTMLLHQREAAIHSMKGLFSAKVRGGFIPIASRVEGSIYYRRPNALRLRGFTPIGGELFEFVQADDLYKLRLPTMGRILTGRQSEMKEMGKLARPFQLSAWAMSGVLGIGTIGKGETVKLAEDGDRYRLDVYSIADVAEQGGVLVRRLWFDRRTLLVVQEDRLSSSGEVDAKIVYKDFRPLEDLKTPSRPTKFPLAVQLLLPFKISLEDGHGQGSVQVTFHEIVPNQIIRVEDLGQVS